ncbi:Os11g0618400 [Oryza sativa Japonica Group]|uniref:Os11g0618400 protein n=1 Tax=Oryza sativa subsp. japonica TaxID=39947 RepID=A0A0P0Y4H2_ORYSJ|nr:Os11g0618400 [Oryza sativa Japonica Group]
MAAMQQRGRLQPAGLYRGVGHQNPAPQPARRYGYLRETLSLGYCILDSSLHSLLIFNSCSTIAELLPRFMEEATKRALVLGATKNKQLFSQLPSSWLPGGTYRKPVTFKTQKPPKPAIAKPVVRTKPAPHLQFRKPEGPISIPEKNHEHHEQNKVKPASSSGKVKFTEFKTSDIDAAVSKPVMRLHEMKDYSVYKSKFGAIMLPKEGASPSMEEFT